MQIKKTISIDPDTVLILRQYSRIMTGAENISAAIRLLARVREVQEVLNGRR